MTIEKSPERVARENMQIRAVVTANAFAILIARLEKPFPGLKQAIKDDLERLYSDEGDGNPIPPDLREQTQQIVDGLFKVGIAK